MGLLSQEGHVGIKMQTSKGVYADPGAVSPNQGVYFRIRSGALGGDRQLLIPDAEIGGNRDIPGAALGPIAFSGQYDFYGRMESLASLLYGALGVKAAPAGATATGFTHTITPGSTLPWFSIEEKIANSFEVFKYTDAKINTLHIEAAADGYFMGTVGLIALKQETTTATAVNLRRTDTSPLLVGTNVLVTYNSIQLPAKSFSLDVNNNLEDNDFRLGSLFLGDLTEKGREVTMAVTIRPENSNLWKQATWGSPGATAPQGQPTYQAAKITVASYEDIPGSTGPAVKYSLNVNVPKSIIAPFSVSPSGDDVLEHDLEIRAVRPDPAVDILSAVVVNSYATVA